ncbi:MAG: hypothetical protein GTN62_06325 [Gemmatimonadales bacterium]|nr:hypothetical protein [Gemmatimonadales bacterium]NIN11115.1 hypothetical protein [Gemmatimonadales bacterium]NIN49712.1 hypothetical protein [Gemmatimonadales bacterium]NIP07176.1 hypothetical protein [Gemmatimonadales bacterium]NIQ99568.1 hypothetical protein [Gemmatimonadales bacterium]
MLRHCTISELLDLRDGEGSSAARAHVEECEACRSELDRLYQRMAALKALPSISPPRDRWPLVREGLVASRRRVRWQRAGWSALAAAASLVMLVGVGAVLRGGPTASEGGSELQTLVEQSRQLDEALRVVGAERRVLNGLTALAIADLEDRVAVIDSQIAYVRTASIGEREMEHLWRMRVAVMDVLVTTHVQQAANVGF